MSTPASEVPSDHLHFALDSVPEQKRRRTWSDRLNEFFYDMDISYPDEFSAGQMSGSHCGGLSIARVVSDTMAVRRSKTEISHDGRDGYFLVLPLKTDMVVRQNGRDTRLAANDFSLISTSVGYYATAIGTTAVDSIIIPGRTLRDAAPNIDDLVATNWGKRGVEKLVVSYAQSVARHILELDDLAKAYAAKHIVELLGVALDGADAHSRITPVRQAHRRRIKLLIERNFTKHGFNLDDVARRLGLSRRYIQELLNADDCNFSDLLRARRLREAQELLKDRRHNLLSVTEIAFRCGYTDPAYFSRSFREAFGYAPKDAR